jgi:hypothetical protein
MCGWGVLEILGLFGGPGVSIIFLTKQFFSRQFFNLILEKRILAGKKLLCKEG